jgi:hypothetical protein
MRMKIGFLIFYFEIFENITICALRLRLHQHDAAPAPQHWVFRSATLLFATA